MIPLGIPFLSRQPHEGARPPLPCDVHAARERLRARLACNETWRALQQLDAREAVGDWLDVVEGGLLRQALVDELVAEPDYRAWCDLEEAEWVAPFGAEPAGSLTRDSADGETRIRQVAAGQVAAGASRVEEPAKVATSIPVGVIAATEWASTAAADIDPQSADHPETSSDAAAPAALELPRVEAEMTADTAPAKASAGIEAGQFAVTEPAPPMGVFKTRLRVKILDVAQLQAAPHRNAMASRSALQPTLAAETAPLQASSGPPVARSRPALAVELPIAASGPTMALEERSAAPPIGAAEQTVPSAGLAVDAEVVAEAEAGSGSAAPIEFADIDDVPVVSEAAFDRPTDASDEASVTIVRRASSPSHPISAEPMQDAAGKGAGIDVAPAEPPPRKASRAGVPPPLPPWPLADAVPDGVVAGASPASGTDPTRAPAGTIGHREMAGDPAAGRSRETARSMPSAHPSTEVDEERTLRGQQAAPSVDRVERLEHAIDALVYPWRQQTTRVGHSGATSEPIAESGREDFNSAADQESVVHIVRRSHRRGPPALPCMPATAASRHTAQERRQAPEALDGQGDDGVGDNAEGDDGVAGASPSEMEEASVMIVRRKPASQQPLTSDRQARGTATNDLRRGQRTRPREQRTAHHVDIVE